MLKQVCLGSHSSLQSTVSQINTLTSPKLSSNDHGNLQNHDGINLGTILEEEEYVLG